MTRPLAPTSFLILLLLLLPSLLFLWRFDDLPDFGKLRDDSLYYVSARSLAEKGTYAAESLPGEPAQTSFPPLYPLLLSVAWRIDPNFPHNLATAAWISWLAWPLMLVALASYAPRLGFGPGRTWLLLILIAVNPFCIQFSAHLVAETLFAALMLFTLLLLDRSADSGVGPPVAIAAGVAGGLAYLTSFLGIALIASGYLFLWIRKRTGNAFVFVGSALPFIAGWSIWSHTYPLDEFHPFSPSLRLNLLPMLRALGSFVIPYATPLGLILDLVVALAMIAGVLRMLLAGDGFNYVLFACLSSILMLVRRPAPDEQALLPLFPLGLAGLVVLFERLFQLARRLMDLSAPIFKVAAATIAAALAAGLLMMVKLQATEAINTLPNAARAQRKANIPNRSAYAWLRAKTPEDAAVFAYFDPLVLLYSGRHAVGSALLEDRDHATVLSFYEGLIPYAKAHGLSYILLNDADFPTGLSQEERLQLEQSIRQNPGLERVWQNGATAVYRVLP